MTIDGYYDPGDDYVDSNGVWHASTSELGTVRDYTKTQKMGHSIFFDPQISKINFIELTAITNSWGTKTEWVAVNIGPNNEALISTDTLKSALGVENSEAVAALFKSGEVVGKMKEKSQEAISTLLRSAKDPTIVTDVVQNFVSSLFGDNYTNDCQLIVQNFSEDDQDVKLLAIRRTKRVQILRTDNNTAMQDSGFSQVCKVQDITNKKFVVIKRPLVSSKSGVTPVRSLETLVKETEKLACIKKRIQNGTEIPIGIEYKCTPISISYSFMNSQTISEPDKAFVLIKPYYDCQDLQIFIGQQPLKSLEVKFDAFFQILIRAAWWDITEQASMDIGPENMFVKKAQDGFYHFFISNMSNLEDFDSIYSEIAKGGIIRFKYKSDFITKKDCADLWRLGEILNNASIPINQKEDVIRKYILLRKKVNIFELAYNLFIIFKNEEVSPYIYTQIIENDQNNKFANNSILTFTKGDFVKVGCPFLFDLFNKMLAPTPDRICGYEALRIFNEGIKAKPEFSALATRYAPYVEKMTVDPAIIETLKRSAKAPELIDAKTQQFVASLFGKGIADGQLVTRRLEGVGYLKFLAVRVTNLCCILRIDVAEPLPTGGYSETYRVQDITNRKFVVIKQALTQQKDRVTPEMSKDALMVEYSKLAREVKSEIRFGLEPEAVLFNLPDGGLSPKKGTQKTVPALLKANYDCTDLQTFIESKPFKDLKVGFDAVYQLLIRIAAWAKKDDTPLDCGPANILLKKADKGFYDLTVSGMKAFLTKADIIDLVMEDKEIQNPVTTLFITVEDFTRLHETRDKLKSTLPAAQREALINKFVEIRKKINMLEVAVSLSIIIVNDAVTPYWPKKNNVFGVQRDFADLDKMYLKQKHFEERKCAFIWPLIKKMFTPLDQRISVLDALREFHELMQKQSVYEEVVKKYDLYVKQILN